MTYEEENKQLLHDHLGRTFFNAWKPENREKEENFSSIELQLNSICDLACPYCYYTNFGKELYPSCISKKSLVLGNLDKLLNWLEEKNLFPLRVELFSGEPLSQNVAFKALYKVVDFYYRNNMPAGVVIPTNGNFIHSKEKTKMVEDIIEYGKDRNVKIQLSFSIDGKYMEDNRPYRNKKYERDDIFYNEIFDFAKKYGFSFHPMVYYNNIEKWKDNFLWFMQNLHDRGMSVKNLYLLEVRNKGWTPKQTKHLYDFYFFLVNWLFEYYEKNNISLKEAFKNHLNMNILSPFITSGRGMSCSLQSTLHVRLGDLSVHPCHRLMYPQFKSFTFEEKDGKIVDILPCNEKLYIGTTMADFKTFPYCETCSIKYLCTGGCLGQQYETMGDPFIAEPTVCGMEHAKIAGIIDGLEYAGKLQDFFEICDKKTVQSIINYLKYIRKRKD